MSQRITSLDDTEHRSATYADQRQDVEVSGWVGWIAFASFMMMLSGIFHAIVGLVAVFNENWFVVTKEQLILFNIETWGWVHLIAGAIIFLAGLSLLGGSLWSRILAVILAAGSAIAYLASISLYPVWSVIGITVAILVIYATTVHGGELSETE